jgi:hypothetical protein
MGLVFFLLYQCLCYNLCIILDTKTEYNLPEEAEHTADFILFMDELFDSLNGNTKLAPQGKPLKGGMSQNSEHETFWRSAIIVLNTVCYYNSNKKKFIKIPSIVNLIKTLQGFIHLKLKLIGRVQYILPRAVNQDCLENFFSGIRGHGRHNRSPDVATFTASFKTLLVNNFFARHSPGANCEPDESSGALDALRCFVTGEEIAGISAIESEASTSSTSTIDFSTLQLHHRKSRVAKATLAYIAGFIGRSLLNKYGGCNMCREMLLKADGTVPLEVIEGRKYRHSSLVKPGTFLFWATSEATSRLMYAIPRLCSKTNLPLILENILSTYINFSVLNCKDHPFLGSKVSSLIVKTLLYAWIKQVNLVLNGKDSKFQIFLKTKPDPRLVDPVKLHANKMYLKKQLRKKNK